MSDAPNPVELQKALGGVDYPASVADLVSAAERNRADDSVLDALRGLPDQEYASPVEVNEAFSNEN
ncbi:DUF2795 domain-containing protein [Arthrobacter sp. JSM 101049]|uniref:DUF2795 domain-containing protein n=1 Tax=Arthrobacter sp. JSM 101049 TaxID=929097 RepID=UPI003569C021